MYRFFSFLSSLFFILGCAPFIATFAHNNDAHTTKLLVNIAAAPNVYSLSTTSTTHTCYVITPYDASTTKELFFHEKACNFLDAHGIDYSADLKNADTRYTLGIALVSNTSTTPLYLVKDSYVVQTPVGQTPTPIIVPKTTFLALYPSFENLGNTYQSSAQKLVLSGALFTSFGGAAVVGSGIAKARDTQQRWPMAAAALGLLVTAIGGTLLKIGSDQKSKNTTPASDLQRRYNALASLLAPRVVAEIISLHTDIAALKQKMATPLAGRIRENSYEIKPGETLIEPIIVKKSSLNTLNDCALSHYEVNPELVFSLHTALTKN